MSVEENTVKYAKALQEELLPKMQGLTFTEVTMKGEEEIWHKPRPATLQEKLKIINVIAERQARLQKQIDWLHERQEYYRKLRDET